MLTDMYNIIKFTGELRRTKTRCLPDWTFPWWKLGEIELIFRAAAALKYLRRGGAKVFKKCWPPWLVDAENFSAFECPKIGFEWPKTAQMAFKFLCFFWNIFKNVQDFPCLSKQFLRTFFFLQGFFHKNSEIFLLKMKTFRPCTNLYN